MPKGKPAELTKTEILVAEVPTTPEYWLKVSQFPPLEVLTVALKLVEAEDEVIDKGCAAGDAPFTAALKVSDVGLKVRPVPPPPVLPPPLTINTTGTVNGLFARFPCVSVTAPV